MGMRSLIVILSCIASGCGPYTPPDTAGVKVILKNDYAESLFTVRGVLQQSLDGGVPSAGQDGGITLGDTITFFESERVDSYRRVTSPSFSVPYNTRITFSIEATSLGTPRRFGVERDVTIGTNTLDMTYDYDLAEGAFGVEYRWY